MKIIKLKGDAQQNKRAIDLLKNRGLPCEELASDFSVLTSINKVKVIEVIDSMSSKKLSKKINKKIKSNLLKGLELIDIRMSTCQNGNYAVSYAAVLIFE